MKRFWKKTEGFTLVELIVVIAILGILAGVGTVGYSGYIAKANKAADEVLLRNLNTAFAAACVENGEDAKNVNAEGITLSNGTVGDIEVTSPAEKVTVIQTAFTKYYADNTSSAFKTVDKLYFAYGLGEFVFPATLSSVQQTAYGKYMASNLQKLGGEEILGTVTDLNIAFTGWLSENDDSVAAFKTAMELIGPAGVYESFMANYGLTESDITGDPEKVTNAVIKHVASSTSKLSDVGAETIASQLRTKNPTDVMIANGVDDLTGHAVLYGVMTNYAQVSSSFKQVYDNTEIKGLSDIDRLYNTMKADSGFEAYVAGDSFEKDIDGFIGAMDLLNSYDGSFDINDPDTYTNENAEAVKLLSSILGK